MDRDEKLITGHSLNSIIRTFRHEITAQHNDGHYWLRIYELAQLDMLRFRKAAFRCVW